MMKAGLVVARRVEDFFLPYDMGHLKAFGYYKVVGSWPHGFLPDNVETLPSSIAIINEAIIESWHGNLPNEVVQFYKEFSRIDGIIKEIKMPGYSFIVEPIADEFSVRVSYDEPDVMTNVVEEQRGRRWVFPANQTAGQIVATCFKAVLTSLEHRTREHFLYRGKAVFQPHFDIDKLINIAPANHVVVQSVIANG